MTMIRLTLRSRGGVFLAAAVLLVCQSCAEKAKEDASRVVQAKPLEERASTDSTASVGSNAEQGQPIREQILTMTPQAAEQLRILRDNRPLKEQAVVRIRLVEGNIFRFKDGGEKRYRYSIVLDDKLTDLSNFYVMESQGLTVVVDKDSGNFLRGTELMWIKSAGRAGFIFRNPNELADDDVARSADPIPVLDTVPRRQPTPIPE